MIVANPPLQLNTMANSLSAEDLIRKLQEPQQEQQRRRLSPPPQQQQHPLLSTQRGSPSQPQDHPLLKPESPSDHPPLSSTAKRPSDHPLLSSGPEPPSSPSEHPLRSSAPPSLPPRGAAAAAAAHQRRAPRSHHRRVHSLPSKPSVGAASSPSSSSSAGGKGGSSGVGGGVEAFGDLMATLLERKKKYGDEHPRVGLAHNQIGNYHFRKGDLSAAANSYNSALQCFSSMSSGDSSDSSSSSNGNTTLGLKHQLDVAVALGNIGAVLWRTGKLAEAIESLEKGIAIRRRVYGTRGRAASPDDGVDMSNALYSLGLARSLHGDYDGAVDALDRAAESLSEPSPDGGVVRGTGATPARRVEAARIEDARGKVHLLRGDADRAMGCHVRALEAKAAAGLGPSHPSVLSTRANVAAAHRARGELDEAAAVYRDVLAAQKLTLYRERDPEARRRATADIGATMRMIGEVQRERGSSAEGMAAIAEERESSRGMGLGAEDDWGLSRSRN